MNVLRFSLRALRASPAFVVLAVLCLSLGIGASTMTFTAVNGVLLKPLGSVDSAGMVRIWEAHESAPNQWQPASLPNVLDWRDAAAGQAEFAAVADSSFLPGPNEAGARVEGAYVTDNLLGLFGVAPLVGRGLVPADTEAGSARVVVLGESYWRREFSGDRAVVGRTLELDGVAHTIVGVVPDLLAVGMPRELRLARLWLPLAEGSTQWPRDDRSLAVFARLGADVGIDGFTARLDDTATALAAVYPENTGWSIRVASVAGGALGITDAALVISFAAATLVLLVACANVANLTLANALRRRREFGIRTAIGASRSMLIRQLLCESFVVSVIGAVLGWALARAGLNVLLGLYQSDNLAPVALPVDVRAVVYTTGLTFLTALLCGLVPAIGASRVATRVQLAESSSVATATRVERGMRRALVVGQVAASLVLLVGASLLSRSLINMLSLDRGVDTEAVTSIRVELLEMPTTPDDVGRETDRIVTVLAAIPGVESAATAGVCLPLRGCGFRSRAASTDGVEDADRGPVVAYTGATPGVFETLGVPLIRGTLFGDDNRRGDSAVVNQSLADLFWPNQDPVGRQFRLAAEPERGPITVTGVAGDFLTWDSSRDTPLPTAFMDVASFDFYPVFFFVRAANGTLSIPSESINRAIESLDVPVRRIVVTPMAQVARDPFWRQRMFSLWFAVFGAAALALTAVGIYGVLSFLVGQRAQEIGIRMALGANRENVLGMILRQGAGFVVGGIAIGLAGAYVLARTVDSLLFGVDPLDSGVFVLVTLFLAVIALVATLVPALRASRIDPNVLLRRSC